MRPSLHGAPIIQEREEIHLAHCVARLRGSQSKGGLWNDRITQDHHQALCALRLDERILHLKQDFLARSRQLLARTAQAGSRLPHALALLRVVKERDFNPEHHLIAVVMDEIVPQA